MQFSALHYLFHTSNFCNQKRPPPPRNFFCCNKRAGRTKSGPYNAEVRRQHSECEMEVSGQSVSDGGEVGEGGDLLQDAYIYLTEHRYPPGCVDSRKRSIRNCFSRRRGKARYEIGLVSQYHSKIMSQGFLVRARPP